MDLLNKSIYKDSFFLFFDIEFDSVFVVIGYYYCDSFFGFVVDLGYYFFYYVVVVMGGGVKGWLDRIFVINGGSSFFFL